MCVRNGSREAHIVCRTPAQAAAARLSLPALDMNAGRQAREGHGRILQQQR